MSMSSAQQGGAPVRRSSFLLLARSIWNNRRLVNELARRELTDLHAGQMGGFIWLLVHPLLMFAVYAVLFTFVFKVRVGEQGPADYLVYLFSGLMPWLFTQDVMTRSSSVMVANAAVVKKVQFPIETLVAKTLLAAMKVQCVLLVTVVIFTIVQRQTVPYSFLLLPVVIGLHLLIVWGIALLLAAITPFLRDLTEVIRIFGMVNIYLMPVIYLPHMAPNLLKFVLVLNPFSHLIWCYQDVLYFGSIQHPWSWGVTAIMAAGLSTGGSMVFLRLRSYIANHI